ncbi:TOBE-like domain-containing protein, partial [Singulisphaera rosea]
LGDGLVVPTGSPGPDGSVSVYVRPYDLGISRSRDDSVSWPAEVRRLLPIGGSVRVELGLFDGTGLEVILTRDRSHELSLARGESVFVAPRDLKVFHEPEGMSVGSWVL